MIKPDELMRAARLRTQPRRIASLVLSLVALYLLPAPLALAGWLVFALLAWRWLELALCLLPLTFPFWYVPKAVVGHAVFPLSELALGACLLAALVRGVGALRMPPAENAATPRSIHDLFVNLLATVIARLRTALSELYSSTGRWLALGAGLLLLGGILGVVVARRPHEALRAFRWEILEPLVYLGLVVLCVRQRAAARVLVWAFLASAALVAVLAYLQVFWLHVTFAPLASGSSVLVRYIAKSGSLAARATGIIYGSGNSLGAWLERALPLALALAVAARGLARFERILALGCVLFLLPPLFWSESRGAQLGAAAACALVLVAAVGRVREALALVGLGALVALWQRDAVLRVLLFGHHGTGEARLLVWLAALHMIRDHPLLGIGPDQFLYYYSARYTRHPYWITRWNGKKTTLALDPTLSHPHDLPLDLWLSVGLLGLIGFGMVLGNFWLRCARLWRVGVVTSEGRWPAALALGLGCSVLAGILHGLVDSAYFVPDLALAFWMSIALLVLLERSTVPAASTSRLAAQVAEPS
jgi:O-antigen ligase